MTPTAATAPGMIAVTAPATIAAIAPATIAAIAPATIAAIAPATIAVIAPGAMGSAVGGRLREGGATVLTSLAGRSAASAGRAAAAGMVAVADGGLAGADVVLSIVPPGEAVALAERLAPVLAGGRAVYVDCNAIDVRTARRVAGVMGAAGVRFADGGIIGGPPKAGEAGPVLYLSGEEAAGLGTLAELGLRVRVMDGPVGAASALKMSYAGITKGLTGLAAAMILAAERAGAAEALHEELGASQAALLARFANGLPDMYGKAYRWVAEMREIAAFVGAEAPEHAIYQGLAGLFEHIAADWDGAKAEVGVLERFIARPGQAGQGSGPGRS